MIPSLLKWGQLWWHQPMCESHQPIEQWYILQLIHYDISWCLQICMPWAHCINNPFYISTCILKDLHQCKNPRVLCWGSSPNFICSPIPTTIFLFYEMGKKRGNKKRVLYIKGGFHTHEFSWGSRTPSSSHP